MNLSVKELPNFMKKILFDSWVINLQTPMIFVQTYTLTVICLYDCLQRTILFWGDLTKPAITIASVERFYLNLVICLQLYTALLVQNSVKNWHCLPDRVMTMYIGIYFFSRTQCIMQICKKKQQQNDNDGSSLNRIYELQKNLAIKV